MRFLKLIAAAVLATALVAGPVWAASQTITPTGPVQVAYGRMQYFTFTTASNMVKANADTATSLSVDLGSFRPSYDSSGLPVRQFTAAIDFLTANVDSIRTEIQFSNSTSGPWLKYATLASETTAMESEGTVFKGVVPAVMRYMRVLLTNDDATTDGKCALQIGVSVGS